MFLAGGDLADMLSDIPDERIEGMWRQIIDVFRGGILADWYVIPLRVISLSLYPPP